jgi:hypothetical protein
LTGRVGEGAAFDQALVYSTSSDPYEFSAADRLISVGNGAAALKLLDGIPLQDHSMNWRLSITGALACAYALTNDATSMRMQLDTLNALRAYDALFLIEALTCAGDEDALAAAVVRGLADPVQRLSVLEALQVYGEKPTRPYRAKLLTRMASLRARPDVKSAVAAVGRIATWDLIRTGRD